MERPWARPAKLQVSPEIERGLTAIGVWIRVARRDAGMTQQHLENVSGVDQTVISRLENGRLLSIRFVRLAAIVGALRDPRVRMTRNS
jgi:predicted transcriptional regulator